MQAGQLAHICAGWLNLHMVWGDSACRGQSRGTSLLNEAEQRTRITSAEGILPNAIDWQAKGLYLRHSQEVFGRLDDYPPEYQRIYMRKFLR